MGPGEEGYMRDAQVGRQLELCACLWCSNIKLINVYAHALIQMWRSVGSLWELVLSFYYVGSRDQIRVSLGLVARFLTKPFHLPNSNLRVLGGYLSDTLIRIERGGVVPWIKISPQLSKVWCKTFCTRQRSKPGVPDVKY